VNAAWWSCSGITRAAGDAMSIEDLRPEISLRAEAGCSSHPGSTSTLTRCPAGDYRVAHLRHLLHRRAAPG